MPDGGVPPEQLRALMAKYGVGDKPIWFTEVGWPTHSEALEYSSVLLAGLKVARPEQKSWNVIVAKDQSEGEVEDQDVAQRLLELLPAGSRVKACAQQETIARLEIPVGPLAAGEHTVSAAVDNVLEWPRVKLARPYYDFYFYGGFYHGVKLVERAPKVFVRTRDWRTGTVEVAVETCARGVREEDGDIVRSHYASFFGTWSASLNKKLSH